MVGNVINAVADFVVHDGKRGRLVSGSVQFSLVENLDRTYAFTVEVLLRTVANELFEFSDDSLILRGPNRLERLMHSFKRVSCGRMTLLHLS